MILQTELFLLSQSETNGLFHKQNIWIVLKTSTFHGFLSVRNFFHCQAYFPVDGSSFAIPLFYFQASQYLDASQ